MKRIFYFYHFFIPLLLVCAQPAFAAKVAKNQKALAKEYMYDIFDGCMTDLPTVLKSVIHGSTTNYMAKKSKKFNPFTLSENKRSPKAGHSVKFGSGAEYYEKIVPSNFNYCRGVTTLVRNFNLLGFYDPKNISGKIIPKEGTKEWVNFYKKIIDDLAREKPTVIPGFNNLASFSSHPKLEPYFQEIATREWAETNIDIRSISILKDAQDPFSKSQRIDFLNELEARLKLNYNPIVYIAKTEEKFSFKKLLNHLDPGEKYVHVMQAYKVVKKTKSYDVYLWTPTYISPKSQEHIVTVPLSDKPMMYSGMDIVPGDDASAMRIFDRLQSFCKKNPVLCKQKKDAPAEAP